MWRELRRQLVRTIPAPIADTLARVRNGLLPAPRLDAATYERLYEAQARQLPTESSIGDGAFDLIGRMELAVLVELGLRPDATLVDFGCGTGRLAVHAVPFLGTGRYVGIDISASMLAEARRRIAPLAMPSGGVELQHQTREVFRLPPASADMICAFSVFTHMEHEDAYRYLRSALEATRPTGRFVLSCLPLDLAVAREIFLASARQPFEDRWRSVRNVATSTEMMESVARMAGWKVVRWLRGDSPAIRLDDGTSRAFGQSILVLEPSSAG